MLHFNKIIPQFFLPKTLHDTAVWQQNFLIQQQEWIQLVAPSGSGKTSLIHFIYGNRKDYAGDIFFNDAEVKSFSPIQLSNYRSQKVSIVFQDLRLFNDQTAFNNIDVKRQLNPFHPKEKIEEMAVQLGVEHKLYSLVNTCSYGEQQRIAIIRALMQPYEIILLDEPFSHLDDDNANKAAQLIMHETQLRKASLLLADLRKISWIETHKTLSL